jgi:hypothetical protein
MLTLRQEDRRLLEQFGQQLQSVAALIRGMLASQPRPVPPGDWGRSQQADPTPRAALMSGPRSIPDPQRPSDEPLDRARPARWRRHTAASIAADCRLVQGWVQELGRSANGLAAEAGIAPSGPYRAYRGHGGLSDNDRERLELAVARLRSKKTQSNARSRPQPGGAR